MGSQESVSESALNKVYKVNTFFRVLYVPIPTSMVREVGIIELSQLISKKKSSDLSQELVSTIQKVMDKQNGEPIIIMNYQRCFGFFFKKLWGKRMRIAEKNKI